MKIKKYIPFLTVFILFALVGPVYAADVDIVCNESGDTSDCNITSPSNKLFEVSNWAPGQTILRSLQVTNDDHNDDCDLEMFTDNEATNPAGFPGVMFTAIKGNGNLLYGDLDLGGNATPTKDFQDIFDSSHISFGSVRKNGGTVVYDWVVTFDKDAGNEYQNSNVTFDFSINFECSHDSTGGGEEGGTVAGIAAPILAFFGAGAAPEAIGGGVEGVTTGTVGETGGGTLGGLVEGIQTCRDSWLIWLLFVLQFIVLFVLNKKIAGVNRKFWYILLSMVLIPLVFYFYLCNKLYALVSLAVSLFWIIF